MLECAGRACPEKLQLVKECGELAYEAWRPDSVGLRRGSEHSRAVRVAVSAFGDPKITTTSFHNGYESAR